MAARDPLIALDPQHRNKATSPWDRGAAVDIDGDGQVAREELEAELASAYFERVRARLEARRIRVIDGFSGDYPRRNRLADELGATLYLAGHLNAAADPSADYGLILVDARAPQGGASRRLAAWLAAEWHSRLPVSRVDVREVRPGDRGHACIGACACPALILESLFLSNPRHQAALTGPGRDRTLDAIAAGIEAAIVRGIETGLL